MLFLIHVRITSVSLFDNLTSKSSCVQLKKALEDLAERQTEKEALTQRCQELDVQVSADLLHTAKENFY